MHKLYKILFKSVIILVKQGVTQIILNNIVCTYIHTYPF